MSAHSKRAKDSTRPALLALCFFLAIFLNGCASNKNLIVEASHSVYRVLIAVPRENINDVSKELKENFLESGKYLAQSKENKVDFYFLYEETIYEVMGSGSCYRVSAQDHFVTNEHVVEMTESNLRFFVITALSPKPQIFPVKVLWQDKRKDLAIIHVPGMPKSKALVLADTKDLTPRMPATALGFPGASDDMTHGFGYEDEEGYLTPKVHTGFLSASYKSYANTKVWEHTAPISPGDSGGPLLNECAQVIGTNNATHIKQQSIVHAIALEELLPELKKLKIPFTQAAAPCVPPYAKTFQTIYLFGFIIILLLLGSTIYLLYLRKQVNKGKIPQINSVLIKKILNIQDKETSIGNYTYKKDVNGRWYRYDPEMGIVYDYDEHKSEAPAKVLKSLTDLPDIAIKPGESLIVGASKEKAQIVINNKYISSAHLKLHYDGKSVTAEDLQSSNGTYINDQKLVRPRALHPGDILALTSEKGLAEYRFDKPVAEPDKNILFLVTPMFPGAQDAKLSADEPVSIGRDEANSIVINDPTISKEHCVISLTMDNLITIKDLSSKNGTYVEGIPERISVAELKPGQVFFLTSKDFSFKLVRCNT